jgi:regulator of PEP synthase PpsR (kinase-PPPase family)
VEDEIPKVAEVPVALCYVMSDSAGETGEAVVRAAAAQFHPMPVDIRRTPYVQSEEQIDQTIKTAAATMGVIVFTLVIPRLREYVLQEAQRHQIPCIDLLSPLIRHFEYVSGRSAIQTPGVIHKLDEDYFKRIEAVEFAVKYDDGRDPQGLLKADIILIGVSRTSKTPLSMYLAHKKFKVANVPLVPELKPPKELFRINKEKIFGLTTDPEKLNRIRKERLKWLGLGEDARYADMQRIEMELEYSNGIMEKLGCRVIDVSSRAVEETAYVIQDILRARI